MQREKEDPCREEDQLVARVTEEETQEIQGPDHPLEAGGVVTIREGLYVLEAATRWDPLATIYKWIYA